MFKQHIEIENSGWQRSNLILTTSTKSGAVFVDLSFNNIEMIEGLDKLTKLQDLTLYNNRISRIENMDMLTELHVLSLGNNNLTDLENVSGLPFFNWSDKYQAF